MKFFCLYLFLLPGVCFSQEIIIGDSIDRHAIQGSEKTVGTSAPIAERLAWDMMYPFGYKKQEKSMEIKLFEEIFLQMKAGVGELSLVIGEFNLQSREKFLKSGGKK